MKSIIKKLFIGLALVSSLGVYGQTPKTDAALTTQSNVIRDETAAGGNTKTRIAAMYQALIDSKINISQLAYLVAGGTDTYTGTITPTPTLSTLRCFVLFTNANTGTATLNINSLGSVTIKKMVNGSLTDLAAGDIASGEVKTLVYNGTYFQIQGGGGVTDANASTKGIAKLYTSTGSNTDGSMDQNSVTAALSGKQASGSYAVTTNNLSDLSSQSTARTNLGLGTLATQSGTFSGTHSGTSSGTNTGDQTNITGNAATVTTNANLTGPITSVGNATSVASQTGTGSTFVMSASPALTGSPTAPTQTAGDNTTKIATDAFVVTNGTYLSTPPEIISGWITGQTMKNRVLTVSHFFRDIDGTAEGSTTYQWVRADDASGTNVANIGSATATTYTLVTADVGKYIACKITPVNTTPETGSIYTTSYVGAVDDVYYPADNANTVISYGVKKMASAYAGNCIQVQLSSGGATTNIGFDANGDLDWSAVSIAAAGGTIYLKIWYDQSGNGFNMTFATFAAQPVVNYTLRRIEWAPTKTGLATHNATMNIGTGDFSFFIEANQKILKDATFSYFSKQTSFSANNFQLYSPIGVGTLMYTGNASSNQLQNYYATPERRGVIAGYRTSTNKYLNQDGVIKTAAEAATDLTSTNNLNFNTGDGGDGDWYMWSFTLYKTNYGADYSKYKKFVFPNSL